MHVSCPTDVHVENRSYVCAICFAGRVFSEALKAMSPACNSCATIREKDAAHRVTSIWPTVDAHRVTLFQSSV